jgi:prepilin-type N-terminal cleavage/methylation domain-containing protein
MNKMSDTSGFTLIETLMAIIILTIAVFTMYAMQTTAIRGNATANALTTSTNWGRDQVEQLLAQDYDDLTDGAGDTDGCAGLGDWPGSDGSDLTDPNYQIYWNVANDCTLKNIVDTDIIPKHVRVIVVRNNMGIQKEIEFNYIKQNTI